MHRYIYALCCAILILSVTDPLEGKRTFGGGRHPKSGGLSGSGGSHSYPSSGGLSGGSHGYPSSGSHYPSSGGLSGGGSGHSSLGGSHAYPSSGGSHTYPSSGGSHGYPAGKGLSGNSPSSGAGHTTNIHNHYHYSPPQQIRYTPAQGGAPVSYPVYHGPPPTYVYQYKDSGSKYGTLLAGLALLNLGTLAGGAYALSHSGHSGSNYKPQPGEVCKFGIKKDNGDYEETKIDCRLITSFIFEEEAKAQNGGVNTTVTTTVTNVTTVNAPSQTPVDQSTYYKQFPNGTMVPLNATDVTAGIISVCWVAGALVGFLPLLGWHAAVGPHPGCYFVEVMDYNYLLFLYFATIVTPSVLLAAFYTHIYRVVVKQMSAVVTVEGGQGRAGTMLRVLGAAQKREVKATQNLAIIVFFFIICWIPLYTMNAIKAFMPELDIPNPITYFCIIFSHVNSAINPLLYAYHLKDFRAALKGLLCTIIGRGVPIPAAYRPPIPVRRPALERCNALRERPRVYVNSPVWLRQKEAERLALEEKKRITCNPVSTNPDLEPFLNQAHAREGLDNVGPFLIESHQESQRSCRKVEDFIRRVRSVSSDRS